MMMMMIGVVFTVCVIKCTLACIFFSFIVFVLISCCFCLIIIKSIAVDEMFYLFFKRQLLVAFMSLADLFSVSCILLFIVHDLSIVARSGAYSTDRSTLSSSVLCCHLHLPAVTEPHHPAVHISFSRFLFHVFVDCRLSLQHCNVHWSACLAMLSSLLSVCQSQFHFHLVSCLSSAPISLPPQLSITL